MAARKPTSTQADHCSRSGQAEVDGTQDQQPGMPWFYHHRGTFYKRAFSGFTVIASGSKNSVPEFRHNCGSSRREVPAPEDPEDESLDGSLELTDWV